MFENRSTLSQNSFMTEAKVNRNTKLTKRKLKNIGEGKKKLESTKRNIMCLSSKTGYKKFCLSQTILQI